LVLIDLNDMLSIAVTDPIPFQADTCKCYVGAKYPYYIQFGEIGYSVAVPPSKLAEQ